MFGLLEVVKGPRCEACEGRGVEAKECVWDGGDEGCDVMAARDESTAVAGVWGEVAEVLGYGEWRGVEVQQPCEVERVSRLRKACWECRMQSAPSSCLPEKVR